MTTKAEIIQQLKALYPTLKIGDEDTGYTDLSSAEYDAQIEQWAENEYLDATAKAKAAADKAALLAKLGITADEAKLLLSSEQLNKKVADADQLQRLASI